MSLWTFVYSVLLCFSVRKRTHPLYEMTHKQLAGEFYLSQSAQSSLSLLAHISSTQKAFGIQRTQSVSAIVDTNKEAKSSLHPPHMGISVITPLPFGGGVGGRGHYLSDLCVFCSSVSFCEKKNIFETRWGVFSLTELTDLTELFHPRFELTERLRHTEVTEAL